MRHWLLLFFAAAGCGGGTVIESGVPVPKERVRKETDEAFLRMERVARKLKRLLGRLRGVGREAETASDRLVRFGVEALAAVKADWEDGLLSGVDVWQTLRRLEAVYIGEVGPGQQWAEKALPRRAVGVDVKAGQASLAAVASALAELNGVGSALTPAAREKARLWGGPFRTPEHTTLREVFAQLATSAGLKVVWRFGAAVLCSQPKKTLFCECFETDIPEEVWKKLEVKIPAYGWDGPVDALLRKMREASGLDYELATGGSLAKQGLTLMMPAGSLREQMGIVALAAGGRWVFQSGGLVLERGGLEIDTELRRRNRINWQRNRLLLPKLMEAWRRIRGRR